MSAPRVVVDPDSGVAPWLQVRDQLVHLVRTGTLPVSASRRARHRGRRRSGDTEQRAAAGYAARAVELGVDPRTAAAAVFAEWPADR